MKSIKMIFSILMTFGFLFTTMSLFGQTVTPDYTDGAISSETYTTLEQFTKSIDWLYGFLIIVTGYLSSFIPFLKNIDKGVYRVLAVAVVIGAAFFFGGQSSIFTLVMTYTVSTSFYEVILKLLAKSPKNKEVTVTE